jgi:hypothetical protein
MFKRRKRCARYSRGQDCFRRAAEARIRLRLGGELNASQLISFLSKPYQLASQIHQSQFLIGGLWLGLAEARRVATASGTDLLRVMISKWLNFISASPSARAYP